MDQWVRGANLTTGRYGHGAVACQGSAFIIGGTNGSDDLDSLEKYDHFNNIWERIRPFISPRFRFILRWICVGGKLDPHWKTEMAPLIERVCSPAVCSFGSKIYVFGGQEGVTMKGYPGMFEECVLHLSFYLYICELT